MNVILHRYDERALDLLLRTKNTRLKNDERIEDWTMERKLEELSYMRDTIKSSWEFVDYTFEILGPMTKNFTHQLVRTRNASYAQESQRTVEIDDHVVVEPKFNPLVRQRGFSQKELWDEAVRFSKGVYKDLLRSGMPTQDARGIMPQALDAGGIFMKVNLRTLHEMALTRLCPRTQGEYQEVFREMRRQVLLVHPYFEDFIQVHCVAVGTCAFPRWGKKECKIYDPRMDLTELIQITKKKFWESTMQVATPVAKNGRTQ